MQTNTDPLDEDGDDLEENDDLKHQKAKSPEVTGEADPFSGDTPGEEYDIDEELGKVGLRGDTDEGITPLGVKSELDEEEP